MSKLCVAGISTILEPSTVASTTTECSRFLGPTALGTHVSVANHGWFGRRARFCGNARVNIRETVADAVINQTERCSIKTATQVSLPAVTAGGVDALGTAVIVV